MKRVGEALKEHAAEQDGWLPERLSDLFYQGYLDGLSHFLAAGAADPLRSPADIDARTSFILLADQVNRGSTVAILKEQKNPGAGRPLVLFSDGSIGEDADVDSTPRDIPTGISAGPGLKVVNWTTARRLTAFKKDEVGVIHELKLSADGTTVAFVADKGVFVLAANGSMKEPIRVGGRPNLMRVEISADGGTVAWLDGDSFAVVARDFTKPATKIKVGFGIAHFRLAPRGDRLVYHFDWAVRSVATTGSEAARKVIHDDEIRKQLGKQLESRGFETGGLDISADGSRIVFGFARAALGVNADGSGLHVVGATEGYLGELRISGNGEKVGYRVAYPKPPGRAGLTVAGWDGKGAVTHDDDFLHGAGGLHLSSFQITGTGEAAVGRAGVRFYNGDGRTMRDGINLDSGEGPFTWLQHVALSADLKRACLVVENHVPQITVVDFRPATIDGVPSLKTVSASRHRLTTDGASHTLVSAEAVHPALAHVGTRLLRHDDLDRHTRAYGGRQELKATGPSGPFSSGAIRLENGWRLPPGPLTLRVFAYDRDGNALVVDLEGLKAK